MRITGKPGPQDGGFFTLRVFTSNLTLIVFVAAVSLPVVPVALLSTILVVSSDAPFPAGLSQPCQYHAVATTANAIPNDSITAANHAPSADGAKVPPANRGGEAQTVHYVAFFLLHVHSSIFFFDISHLCP